MTSRAPAALKLFSSTGSLPGLPFFLDCMGGFSLLNQELSFLPFVGVSLVWFSISPLISVVAGFSFSLPLHLFALAVVELYRVASLVFQLIALALSEQMYHLVLLTFNSFTPLSII